MAIGDAYNSFDATAGGSDSLFGGAGADLLYGDSGWMADSASGGDDTLCGEDGPGLLSGDSGNDRYIYQKVSHSPAGCGRDVILNFNGVGRDPGDRIDLADVDANAGSDGNQTFVFRGTRSFTGAGQVRVVNQDDDTLVQINTKGARAAEMEIVVQDGGASGRPAMAIGCPLKSEPTSTCPWDKAA